MQRSNRLQCTLALCTLKRHIDNGYAILAAHLWMNQQCMTSQYNYSLCCTCICALDIYTHGPMPSSIQIRNRYTVWNALLLLLGHIYACSLFHHIFLYSPVSPLSCPPQSILLFSLTFPSFPQGIIPCSVHSLPPSLLPGNIVYSID